MQNSEFDQTVPAAGKEGRTIVLLGSKGSGKTHLLLTLAGLVQSPRTNLKPLQGRFGYCSHQLLLHSHLTARENLRLAAALYGIRDEVYYQELLARGHLLDQADRKAAYALPRSTLRHLSLLVALLPDPGTLLIDDLTWGLSLPARRRLWQWLRLEQSRRPRNIIFATRDVEAVRTLAGEVWFMIDGQVAHQWTAAQLPAALLSSGAFSFRLKTAVAAQKFHETLDQNRRQSGVHLAHLQDDGHTVDVVVDQASQHLLDLMWQAGRDVENFATLPLEIDRLPGLWHQSDIRSNQSHIHIAVLEAAVVEKPCCPLSRRQKAYACGQIALSEWRRHFRRFFKAANLLFSAIYLLLMLKMTLPVLEMNPATFWTHSPLLLLFAAAMILGFATEPFGRWRKTGHMDTLFNQAQPPAAGRPLSLLILYDLARVSRHLLLAGLCLGAFLVLLSHMGPLLLFWPMVVALLQPQPWPAIASLLFWLLMVLNGLALAILLSQIGRGPGWGLWLGWAAWFLFTLSLATLPPVERPLLWLWPVIGLATAFSKSLQPATALLPFLLGFIGSSLLWLWAIRSFNNQ